jgi:tRNA pseudouridine32 synthase/23S rRNA pseudouridine746 synthase
LPVCLRSVNGGTLALFPVAGVDAMTLPSRLQLPPGHWSSLLDGLCARFPRIDRAQWQDRFARGRVQDAQGRALAPDMPWQVGLEIQYFREVADEPVIPFAETILHLDAHLLVADKPHFLPVTPAGGYVRETLLSRLVARTGNTELVPLHRLDRLTAGLVLFSTQAGTRDAYQRLFRERRIGKTYEALAPALPGLAFPLQRDSRLVPGEPFFRMAEVPGEPNARSRIELIEAEGPVWRYRLRPETGRKHQLRVHMAMLGAPIEGDDLYPQLRPRPDETVESPLQLLAQGLAFDDPLSGEPRRFSSQRRLCLPGQSG